MRKLTKAGTPFYVFDNLYEQPSLSHLVSTRHGGVSTSPYDTLNLGFRTGDDLDRVSQNRERVSRLLNITPSSIVFPSQVHGGNATIVSGADRGRGAYTVDDAIPETDALITNAAGTCLAILVADCVPIVFFDPVQRVIAVAHAGWKGTVKKIAYVTVMTIRERFHSHPADILVGLGPSIGPECYEIGRNVVDAATANGISPNTFQFLSAEKARFDLWSANRQQLLEAGIADAHIETAGICTRCHHAEFFSARSANPTGRFTAAIMLQ